MASDNSAIASDNGIIVMVKLRTVTHYIMAVFEIKGTPCMHGFNVGCMILKSCAPGMYTNFPNI